MVEHNLYSLGSPLCSTHNPVNSFAPEEEESEADFPNALEILTLLDRNSKCLAFDDHSFDVDNITQAFKELVRRKQKSIKDKMLSCYYDIRVRFS